jgi:hypothetical protein
VPTASGWDVAGDVRVGGSPVPSSIDVTLETDEDETTKSFPVESGKATFRFATDKAPARVVVDKYNQTAKRNGGVFSLESLGREFDQTIIVYGTNDDRATNEEAAQRLQRALAESWTNEYVTIKSDRDMTDDELKSHHLILIGRPSANLVAARFAKTMPVEFGRQSFTVRGKTYGHARSAIEFAFDNPINGRYGIVMIAGNSAAATLRACSADPGWGAAPAKLTTASGEEKRFVISPAELVKEFASE